MRAMRWCVVAGAPITNECVAFAYGLILCDGFSLRVTTGVGCRRYTEEHHRVCVAHPISSAVCVCVRALWHISRTLFRSDGVCGCSIYMYIHRDSRGIFLPFSPYLLCRACVLDTQYANLCAALHMVRTHRTHQPPACECPSAAPSPRGTCHINPVRGDQLNPSHQDQMCARLRFAVARLHA